MVEHVTVAELVDRVVDGSGTVIDVREFPEFVSGHIPGARHVPLHLIPIKHADIPSDGSAFVICESGARSWQAAAFLERQGISVLNVQGGMAAWRANGLATATGAEQS